MRWTLLIFGGISLAGCLCIGCVPLRFVASPGASGTVIDSKTHAPVSGAEVAISLCKYPPPSVDDALAVEREPKVTTDQSGQFSVPPDRRWGIYIWPVDSLPEFGLLLVKHDGYEVAQVPIWSRSVTNVGQVILKPAKPGALRDHPSGKSRASDVVKPPGSGTDIRPPEPK
jgi:hypothetical protein